MFERLMDFPPRACEPLDSGEGEKNKAVRDAGVLANPIDLELYRMWQGSDLCPVRYADKRTS